MSADRDLLQTVKDGAAVKNPILLRMWNEINILAHDPQKVADIKDLPESSRSPVQRLALLLDTRDVPSSDNELQEVVVIHAGPSVGMIVLICALSLIVAYFVILALLTVAVHLRR